MAIFDDISYSATKFQFMTTQLGISKLEYAMRHTTLLSPPVRVILINLPSPQNEEMN